MRFADIPIHLQLKERLIYLSKSEQVPHAQLFWGPPGNASLTLAIAFATYLHCNNKLHQDACGVCNSCIKMDKLVHPDIKFTFPINTSKTNSDTEITSNTFLKRWYPFIQQQPYGELADWSHHIGAEHKQLIIPRAETTYINQYASLQSFKGGYKIIIIWLPEYLHPTAANAMLKIVEDPPPQTIFLLVSIMPDKILNTLRSRLQPMYVPAFADEAISQLITRDHKLTSQKLTQIVGLAEGNLNKAYKLIEETNDKIFEEFKSWMRVCYAQDFTKLMEHVERFQELQKENQKSFLAYVLYMVRQITLIQFNSQQLLRAHEQEHELAKKLATLLNYEFINEINKWLGKAYYHIDRNLNPKILFLNLSLKFTQIFKAVREKAT